MSTRLARRRRIPAPAAPMVELEVDLGRLRHIYEQIPEFRREGEALIRAAREAGVPVRVISELTGLTPQRAYQILNASTMEDDDGERVDDPD